MSDAPEHKSTKRTAVFLDRDGTLIEDVHYLADPADVRLLPGAAEAVCAFNRRGLCCVVISNQSAIGRGIIDEAQLDEIHDELRKQLAEHGASLDAIYWCPVVPTTNDRTVIEDENRKPGPGMLLRAAEDLNLDLSRSWMVGDSLCDLLAGKNAGCFKNVLVNARKQEAEALRNAACDYETAVDMDAVTRLILEDPETAE